MRFMRMLICSSVFRNKYSCYCVYSQVPRFIRVVSVEDDKAIKLSFKLSKHSSAVHMKAPKDEDVDELLKRIKRVADLQREKEEMRRTILNKYSYAADIVEESEQYSLSEVCLLRENTIIHHKTLNSDAWSQASVLKIGDLEFKVLYNAPIVTSLSLPEFIVSCCIMRPHFLLECACVEDCTFTWYRSSHFDARHSESDDNGWIKVGEGLHYLATPEDVGFYLKVVCTPRRGDVVGPSITAVSQSVVEAGPKIFPFEERHIHTPVVHDNECFRCVSYNTLANVYVDRRKFPYASKKARDVYYRKQLLLRELLGYNTDILCLQEIQERVFEYDLYPVLKRVGLEGYYKQKGGRTNEGVATFFQTSKFRVLKNEGILLNEIINERRIFLDLLMKVSGNYKDMSKLLAQDTALQVLILQNIHCPDNKILVANTHLYSNKNTPEVRLIQAALCVNYLEHILKTESMTSDGILFCGDFNSLPGSDALNFLASGNFECCPSWKNDRINSDSNEDSVLRHNLSLESACGIPEYTNFTEEFQGCLDYIFYSKNSLVVKDVVPMPSHDSVTAQGWLPSEYFPSDHLALICTLKWKNSKS